MKKIASVCPYCGAGCKLNLVVENNRIIRAEAAEGATNQGTLCLKGFYGWDFLNDTRLLTPRLTQPMIRYRKGEAFTPVTWEEAIRYTARKLSSIKAQFGPRSIMTTGSSRGTGNETNYVNAKICPRGTAHQQRRLLRARLSRSFRRRTSGDPRQRCNEQLYQRY